MFQADVIDTGDGLVQAQMGYISISFVDERGADFCGWAYVGANPGEIVMNFDRCPSACGRFAPETLAHEIRHALGFYHTSGGGGIMHTDRTRCCATSTSPPRSGPTTPSSMHARTEFERRPRFS